MAMSNPDRAGLEERLRALLDGFYALDDPDPPLRCEFPRLLLDAATIGAELAYEDALKAQFQRAVEGLRLAVETLDDELDCTRACHTEAKESGVLEKLTALLADLEGSAR
jgi:hypothetical protein